MRRIVLFPRLCRRDFGFDDVCVVFNIVGVGDIGVKIKFPAAQIVMFAVERICPLQTAIGAAVYPHGSAIDPRAVTCYTFAATTFDRAKHPLDRLRHAFDDVRVAMNKVQLQFNDQSTVSIHRVPQYERLLLLYLNWILSIRIGIM